SDAQLSRPRDCPGHPGPCAHPNPPRCSRCGSFTEVFDKPIFSGTRGAAKVANVCIEMTAIKSNEFFRMHSPLICTECLIGNREMISKGYHEQQWRGADESDVGSRLIPREHLD